MLFIFQDDFHERLTNDRYHMITLLGRCINDRMLHDNAELEMKRVLARF